MVDHGLAALDFGDDPGLVEAEELAGAEGAVRRGERPLCSLSNPRGRVPARLLGLGREATPAKWAPSQVFGTLDSQGASFDRRTASGSSHCFVFPLKSALPPAPQGSINRGARL